MADRLVRWTRGSRKHKIGRGHARHVMTAIEPTRIEATDTDDARLEWIGEDDRGVELEITAIELPDYLLVIHVMPTALRRNP